jgi:hypothetical protein
MNLIIYKAFYGLQPGLRDLSGRRSMIRIPSSAQNLPVMMCESLAQYLADDYAIVQFALISTGK